MKSAAVRRGGPALAAVVLALAAGCDGPESPPPTASTSSSTSTTTSTTVPSCQVLRVPPGPIAISSPGESGAIPLRGDGTAAYSPDGLFYAQQVDSVERGTIGVFEVGSTTTSPVRTIDFSQYVSPSGSAADFPNRLKALAWSPDCQLLAAMFHAEDTPGAKRGHVDLRNTISGQPVRTPLTFEGDHPHYMRFSPEGREILVGQDPDRIDRAIGPVPV